MSTPPDNVPLSHEPRKAAFRPVLFYAFAFAIAWSAWTPLLLHKLDIFHLPVPFPITLFVGQSLGAFAPVLSLFVIQKISRDSGLVKRVFGRLRFKGLPVFWYLVPALTPIVATVVLSIARALIWGGEFAVLRPEPVEELGWMLLAIIPFQFALGMIGSPLGEEPGWRGYVFDGFVQNGRASLGSGVVAVLWWVWHLPLFIVLGVEPTPYTLLGMVGHSLLMDSFFLLSGRNLLVAMLYHQGINTSFLFFMAGIETPFGSGVLLVFALTVRVAVTKGSVRECRN